ncbi:phosphonate ABC transporter ATP-binding protein [Paenibacillus sp. J2TS4]|uniref:phosphonate ABC transporter ATP-binding protein n=1 Tax=Paenibacillus sp. J2TS4 TaxID=2807194 RepID=UPI001B0CAAED|nr:ATP-binding cassette domain-containing protein [Paenibacillus sp. J2TS4]GIP32762.1 phosphonates import ATP-binding protein PhnC [Paenibacillus sp. J2TS4]
MIIVRNLTKRFDSEREVLSKISFQADKGDFIAILGGSGSGKTTLLRCLSLQESWSEGQFIYEGNDITSFNFIEKMKIKRKWAMIEEQPYLNLNMTAIQNVLSGRYKKTSLLRFVTRVSAKNDHLEAMDLLEHVELLDKAREKTAKLSGGERQRVAIAQALVQGTEILFADEPVIGLPPESANRVMEDLRNISRKKKVTIICTVNNVELAERFSSRIWGLAGGRIVLDIAARKLTLRERDLIFK